MSDLKIDGVLAQMRNLAASGKVAVAPPGDGAPAAPGAADAAGKFANLITDSLQEVNQTSKQAGALQDSFLRGDPNVTLAQVSIAGQKAQITFQSLLQVRNRVVDAYHEIMRMPI